MSITQEPESAEPRYVITVRCKVCMTTCRLSYATVVKVAELATFTAAHDHDVIDFDVQVELNRPDDISADA